MGGFLFSPNSFSYRGSYFSLGMKVRRFCGFLAAEAVTQGVVTGCRWRCRLVCVGVRVRRSKTGLSDRVSLEVSSDACTGGCS